MSSKRPNALLGFTVLEIALVVVIIVLFILALIPAFRGKPQERRFPISSPAPLPTPSALPADFGVPTVPTATPLSVPATPEPTPQ